MKIKEFSIFKIKGVKVNPIFNTHTEEHDFTNLELHAYKFLSKEFNKEIKKYTFVYNQLETKNIYHLGREGKLRLLFDKYTVHIIAVINAAKLLGIEIELRSLENNNIRIIYIR